MPTDTLSKATRTVAITGATSGIGFRLAERLGAKGWSVAALGRNRRELDRLAAAIGDRCLPIEADVSDETEVIRAFAEIARVFGRLDALAACAGISDATPFEEIDAEHFTRILQVNTVGTFLCMREALKTMESGGRICTVSSVAGVRGGGVFGTAAYSASKGALIALTKTAARTFAPRNITVNCVVPGSTHTPMLDQYWNDEAQRERVRAMIPIGRPGTSDEIASAIEWVISEESGFMTGSTIVVDGGLTML
ncbi:MAG TPA: SDR family NAD(P)-dependent oxidoreductase [Mycoplana sp.]|nr:SDR family NAD(P)-dependent oxidoreductase [Mycoplana sp.]